MNAPLASHLGRALVLGLLAVSLIGCGRKTAATIPAAPADPPPQAPTQPSKTETRNRWVYEQGWFARGQGDAWFEHNDEAQRIRGKAWEFRQNKATPEFIELYDASRGVTVRLSDTDAQARWDKDGKDAEWRPLMTGRWEETK